MSEDLNKLSDAEMLNRVSDLVVGYREGKNSQIIDRLMFLLWLERNHNQCQKIHLLFDGIHDLSDMADEIENEKNLLVTESPQSLSSKEE